MKKLVTIGLVSLFFCFVGPFLVQSEEPLLEQETIIDQSDICLQIGNQFEEKFDKEVKKIFLSDKRPITEVEKIGCNRSVFVFVDQKGIFYFKVMIEKINIITFESSTFYYPREGWKTFSKPEESEEIIEEAVRQSVLFLFNGISI